MPDPRPRREFLKAAALVSTASLTWNLPAAGEAGEKAAARRARLLPGCCAYSYRSYLANGKMTMEE